MVIRKVIKIPVYRTEILVVFTDEMQKTVNKYSPYPDAASLYEAVTIEHSGNPIVIFDFTPSASVLSHEIFHAVDAVLSLRGLPLIEGSEEAYAYMIGYVTECIYKFIKKTPSIHLQ
jgi:hypothetical protein